MARAFHRSSLYLLVAWWLLFRRIARPTFRYAPAFTAHLIRSGSTFLGIDGLVAITSSSNVMLSPQRKKKKQKRKKDGKRRRTNHLALRRDR